MFGRQTSGSVVCPSCGSLVGVRDPKCFVCGRPNPSLWGFAPVLRNLGRDFGLIPFIVGVTVVVFGLMVLGVVAAGGTVVYALMSTGAVGEWFGESGASPLFDDGAWWTLLTATWLHGSIIHLAFNMMAVRSVGPATVELIGPGRTLTIYVLSGVSGFLLTSLVRHYFPYIPFLQGAHATLGASASICGLLGAISCYGQRSGSGLIRAQTSQWGISLVVMGLILPGIDNVAHLGGFLGGYALCQFFNPLTRERGDHLLIGLSCLAVSLLALAWVLFNARWLIFS